MFMKRKLNQIVVVIICIGLIILSDKTQYIQRNKKNPETSVTAVEYMDYSILNGNYSFKLPENYELKERKFEGGEIIYHGDFKDKNSPIRGIIQVWNIKTPLAKFLKESKLGGTGIVEYKYYKIENIKLGALKAYLLSYSRLGNDGKYYVANEFYIPKTDTEFFRMSFFTPEEDYNENLKEAFKNIALYIKIN